jgi:hypothetical protein
MKLDPNRVNPLAGPIAGRHLADMTGKDQEREERLAAALRENLRRRKAQSRDLDAAEKKDASDG